VIRPIPKFGCTKRGHASRLPKAIRQPQNVQTPDDKRSLPTRENRGVTPTFSRRGCRLENWRYIGLSINRSESAIFCGGKAQRRHRFCNVAAVPKRRGASLPAALHMARRATRFMVPRRLQNWRSRHSINRSAVGRQHRRRDIFAESPTGKTAQPRTGQDIVLRHVKQSPERRSAVGALRARGPNARFQNRERERNADFQSARPPIGKIRQPPAVVRAVSIAFPRLGFSFSIFSSTPA
jgi:hypothetical protein